MRLREYKTSDCGHLAELFYHTVHSVNAKDYTKEQLDAWATGIVDLKEWDESFLRHHTVVAVENHEIVGFGDIDDSGYLDRLFVHQDHQGKGIASAICDELEYSVSGKKITTHSSITARAFFEHRGYRVIQEQTVIRSRIPLTNYIMEKSTTSGLSGKGIADAHDQQIRLHYESFTPYLQDASTNADV